MQAIVGHQREGHDPKHSMRGWWILGTRRRLTLRDVLFYEERFVKVQAHKKSI